MVKSRSMPGESVSLVRVVMIKAEVAALLDRIRTQRHSTMYALAVNLATKPGFTKRTPSIGQQTSSTPSRAWSSSDCSPNSDNGQPTR
jgi:hypothetical protein